MASTGSRDGDSLLDALLDEVRRDLARREELGRLLFGDRVTRGEFATLVRPVDFRDAPPTAVFGVCPDQSELPQSLVPSFPIGGLNNQRGDRAPTYARSPGGDPAKERDGGL